MKIKAGASIVGLKIEMRKALLEADRVYKHHGEELVITSGLDGTHSAGSLHYYGYAIDIRTRSLHPSDVDSVVKELKKLLSPDFDVVYETTHIHIEYQKVIDNLIKEGV